MVRVILLLLIVSIISCEPKKILVDQSLRNDSIFDELLRYHFLAYHETSDEYIVVDEVFVGVDSVFLEESGTKLMKRASEPYEYFEVAKGSLLTITECNDSVCTLNIYDSNRKFIGRGFLWGKATVRLVNPYVDKQKLDFYNAQEQLIARYNKLIQRKYNLTDRQFDSVLYINIDRLRRELTIN